MNRYLLTTITVISIIAMAFTACTKKSETQTSFNIYSIWRYVSSADVEHGETWVNEGEKSIAIFNDGEYAVVISGSYAWRGVLHDRGDYSYTFNAVNRLDYETGTVHNVEGQGPYTFVLKYDPQTRQLISADGTVEEYYEWFSESGFVPDIDFSSTHQEILTEDISAFLGTWVTVHGQTMQIKANGRLQLINNNFHYFSDDYEADVYIFPAGVEFAHWSGTVRTDTTRDRVFIQYGSERTPTNDDVYYREGEAHDPNAKFLTADISAFAGTWVNSGGRTYTIPQTQSLENEFPGGFKQFENYYTWWHPAGDFGIYLVPVGVDLILHGNVIPTDKTKIRLVTEDLHSAPVIYYREGE